MLEAWPRAQESFFEVSQVWQSFAQELASQEQAAPAMSQWLAAEELFTTIGHIPAGLYQAALHTR
jgi:hypothetical protein